MDFLPLSVKTLIGLRVLSLVSLDINWLEIQVHIVIHRIVNGLSQFQLVLCQLLLQQAEQAAVHKQQVSSVLISVSLVMEQVWVTVVLIQLSIVIVISLATQALFSAEVLSSFAIQMETGHNQHLCAKFSHESIDSLCDHMHSLSSLNQLDIFVP